MKKGLKKLILLLVVALTVGVQDVSAETFTVGQKFNKSASSLNNLGIHYENIKGTNTNYVSALYAFNNVDGNSFNGPGYCIDFQQHAGNQFKVRRLLLDPSYSKEVLSSDAGIIKIVSSGNYNNTSAQAEYVRTTIAVRAYSYLLGYATTSTSSKEEISKAAALVNLGIEWSIGVIDDFNEAAGTSCSGSDDQIRTCLRTYARSNNRNGSRTPLSWYTNEYYNATLKGDAGTYGVTNIDAAGSLFQEGVKKNAEVMRSGITNPQFKISMGSKDVKEKSETYQREILEVNILIQNLSEKGEVLFESIDCPTCSANGVTINSIEYAKANYGGWDRLYNGKNLADEIYNNNGVKNGQVRIRLDVTKRIKQDDCSNSKFTVNLKWKNGNATTNDEYEGAILEPTNGGGQRFVVVNKKTNAGAGDYQPLNWDGYITCEGSTCETDLKLPICSTNEEDANAKITAPDNVKKCVINKNDDAGNSYQLSVRNGGVENDYCSVFCKEDYSEIKLNPVVDNVVCGGYFQLKSKVKGQKDCYTGSKESDERNYYSKFGHKSNGANSIDKVKYLEDLEDIQNELVNATNEYNKWYEYHLAVTTDRGTYKESQYSSKIGRDTEYGYYIFEEPANLSCGDPDEEHINQHYVIVIGDYYEYLSNNWSSDININMDEKTESFDLKDPQKRTLDTYEYRDNWICYCNPHAEKCDPYPRNTAHDSGQGHLLKTRDDFETWDDYWDYMEDYTDYETYKKASTWFNEVRREYEEAYKAAKLRLDNAIAKYKQIVSDYNACTTAWTNNYKFAQRIKYYYNEYHNNNAFEPYYDLLAQAGNNDLYYLEKDGAGSETGTITVCTGRADENYNCQDGKIELDMKNVSEGANGIYNSNSTYGEVFQTKKYIECNPNNPKETRCELKDRLVSQASFVKKTRAKEQNYITPTSFYQIEANGKITVNSGYTGNKLTLDAIKNGLPVSTSTTGGGVFKLQLDDLGEFYDTGELGRLIDFQGENEDKSVAKSKGGVEYFDGNYVCHYNSPCMPDDHNCPNCKFDCVGDSCQWDICPECTFDCVNCIFNLDQLILNFKTVSTTNFDNIGRDFGYNWVTSSTLGQLGLISKKAEATVGEIKDANEQIYDDSNKDSDSSSLAFSIKMTPDVTKAVKKYNESAEGKGGYTNDSLTCYAANVGGKEHKNIFCYSELIDELVEDYGDSITVKNRINKNGNREANSATSGYWKLWDGYVYNESVLGGPSWK